MMSLLPLHSHDPQGVKEHKCRICGREFTLLANMKRHVLIHTNIRAYQCHMCFKSFVQKQTLKAHMIVHSDIKPYKCKVSNVLNGKWLFFSFLYWALSLNRLKEFVKFMEKNFCQELHEKINNDVA